MGYANLVVFVLIFNGVFGQSPNEEPPPSKAQKFCSDYAKSIPSKNAEGQCNNVQGKEFDIFRNTSVSKHTKTVSREFPHLALIGYDTLENPRWFYTGSLISNRWVVTAAHCLVPRASEHGPPSFVRLGEFDYATKDDDSDPQDFIIIQAIQHPEYNQTASQKDIALLKLDRDVIFSDYIRPACLWENFELPTQPIVAAGLAERWDELPKSYFIKNKYKIFARTQCRKYNQAWLEHHDLMLQDDQQICAGPERFHWPDHCPFWGSPLEIPPQPEHKCMHYLIGLYSFGQPDCLLVFKPDIVYTRISYYVPWIESIVWVEDWIIGWSYLAGKYQVDHHFSRGGTNLFFEFVFRYSDGNELQKTR